MYANCYGFLYYRFKLYDTISSKTGIIMRKAFIAMSESYHLISRFMDGIEDRDFYLSYTHELPNLEQYDLVSFWMSGAYAAKLHRIGLGGALTAPGRNWLSDIDQSLTKRFITTDRASQMPENIEIFAKPAEAKIDAITAGKYTKAEILEICKTHEIAETQLFQWTEQIININHEHRFFVAHQKIEAGSPYFIDKVIYHRNMISPFYDDAVQAVERFIQELGDNQPPAYTLDVGRNEDTGEWLIIEANPAWSSGIYGCDPASVIKVLEVACNSNDPKWLWKPAENLVNFANRHEPIKILDDIKHTSGVSLFKGK